MVVAGDDSESSGGSRGRTAAPAATQAHTRTGTQQAGWQAEDVFATTGTYLGRAFGGPVPPSPAPQPAPCREGSKAKQQHEQLAPTSLEGGALLIHGWLASTGLVCTEARSPMRHQWRTRSAAWPAGAAADLAGTDTSSRSTMSVSAPLSTMFSPYLQRYKGGSAGAAQVGCAAGGAGGSRRRCTQTYTHPSRGGAGMPGSRAVSQAGRQAGTSSPESTHIQATRVLGEAMRTLI